jgi:hypothetical protein
MSDGSIFLQKANVSTKSLLLIYFAFYFVYHLALGGEKFNVLFVTTSLFILGLTPYLVLFKFKISMGYPANSSGHNKSTLAAFALILFAIYISFSDILFALSQPHRELHDSGGWVSSGAILIINTATLLLSLSLPVADHKPKIKRFIIIGLVFILLIAVPFSRNPALPALFTLVIISRPTSFSNPISKFNILIGAALIFSLVFFDLRRAFGTVPLITGEALSNIDLFRYFFESAELQVVNRIHDALEYTNYATLDKFIDAFFFMPFLNLFSAIDYSELPSVHLSHLYETTGGFSMLMMAYMVNPALIPFVSFTTFGLGLIVLKFLNQLFPTYTNYSLAIVCAYYVNSFRIDFPISLKMVAGYIFPLFLVILIKSMSHLIFYKRFSNKP